MSGLREGWHHSRFEPYVQALAPDLARLPNFRGELAPRVCAEIDVEALLSNTTACMEAAAGHGCGLIAVIKADAYGHGAAVVAQTLYTHRGVRFFAVATLPEALELRAAGLAAGEVRVVVLGASVPSEWEIFAEFGLEMVVESARTAELLCALPGGDAKAKLGVHVMLNTGMNRIGLATFDSTTETHGRPAPPAPNRPKLEDMFSALGPVPEDASPPRPPPDRSSLGLPPGKPPALARSDSLTSTSSIGSSGRCQEYHGVLIKDAVSVVGEIAAAPRLDFVGLCTHMADATNVESTRYTQRQFGRFRDIVYALRERHIAVPAIHVENSETLLSDLVGGERMRHLLGPETAGYCRVGGALYGQRHHSILKPVLSLMAQVRHVHRLEKGMTVGYDRSWIAPDDCLIATLRATVSEAHVHVERSSVLSRPVLSCRGGCAPLIVVVPRSCGFADGYSRTLSNQGVIAIRGHRFRVAGKVCMDMLMVYLGEPNGVGKDVQVGDYATLWGHGGGQTLAETADQLGTAQSDLTCDLSRRVSRRYVNLPETWIAPRLRAT